MTKAGCQPFWNRFDMGGTPFCKNASTLQQYSDEVTKFSYLYKNELVGETKCLIPCSFTVQVLREQEAYPLLSLVADIAVTILYFILYDLLPI